MMLLLAASGAPKHVDLREAHRMRCKVFSLGKFQRCWRLLFAASLPVKRHDAKVQALRQATGILSNCARELQQCPAILALPSLC